MIARRLVALDPSDAEAANDISVSLEKVGDVQAALGDPAAARASHEESLAIARRLAARNPSDAGAARNLWVSLNKVGDVQVVLGDLAGASASYEEGLPIARRLAALDPTNPGPSRDLALSLTEIGDVQVARGDLAGALASYEESLAIGRRLVAQDPSDAGAARDLSVGLNKVGDVTMARGDAEGALIRYQESLTIRRRMAAQDPSHVGASRDVSVSLGRLAVVQIGRERFPEACRYIAEGLAILLPFRERVGIAKAFLDELAWFERHRSAHCGPEKAERLGNAAYAALIKGDVAGALTMSDDAVALAPDLVWLQTNRAHALMMLGRTDEARAIYLRYRGQIANDGKPWEIVVREDFAEMRTAGLAHPLMDEIEAAFTPR